MVVCGHVKLGDAYGFPKKKKKTSYMNSFYSKKKKIFRNHKKRNK